jgi:hypothetical protein
MSNDYKEIFDKLLIASELDVQETGATLKDLWLVKHNGKTHGPYLHQDLDELSEEHSELLSHLEICNIEDEQWDSFYNHDAFQRRETKLFVPVAVEKEEEEDTEKLVILKDGHKTQAYSLVEIKEMIDNAEIKITDDASNDDGHTWFKLYQHQKFDKRTHDELPNSPNNGQFESSKMEIIQTEQIRMNNDKEDVLVGLAYLSHTDKYKPKSKISSILPPVKASANTYKKLGIIASCFVLALFFMYNNKVDNSKGNVTTNKTITSKYSTAKKRTPNVEKLRKPSNVRKKSPVKVARKKVAKKTPSKKRIRRRRKLPTRSARRTAQKNKYKNRKRKVKTYKKFHKKDNPSANKENDSYDNVYSNNQDESDGNREPASGSNSNGNQAEDGYNDDNDQ